MLGAFPELETTCYKKLFFKQFCFQSLSLSTQGPRFWSDAKNLLDKD